MNMTLCMTLTGLIGLTLLSVPLLVARVDRKWIVTAMLLAWIGMFGILVLVDASFPFAGGGDDEGYFRLAATSVVSFSDVFNLTGFVGVMEQPGYPWLLSLLYQVTGHDLLALKVLNLACFLLLIPVWHRIAIELGSRRLARAVVLGVLCLTPLWYYWMFLLKDVVIALLQSVFLLGAVQVSANRGRSGWILVLLSTLAVIPFRSQLVLIHIAVLIGVVGLMFIRRGQRGGFVVTLLVCTMLIAVILRISSDSELMGTLGIYTETRVVGTQSFIETARLQGDSSMMSRSLFPVLYLFSETSGLNLDTWTEFGAGSIRGILAIPWIVVLVPFFLLGVLWLVKRDPAAPPPVGLVARVQSLRVVTTAWGAVLVFILVYMMASWTVGDTTRWRLPDMPALATVAVAGCLSVTSRQRLRLVLLWLSSACWLFALFYWVRG